MASTPQVPAFWTHWLTAVAGGVVAFGLVLVMAPS